MPYYLHVDSCMRCCRADRKVVIAGCALLCCFFLTFSSSSSFDDPYNPSVALRSSCLSTSAAPTLTPLKLDSGTGQCSAPRISLTYNNTAHTDGAGSQLQRVLSIFAVSKALGLGYLHTGLTAIDYQGLAALEANAGQPHAVDRWNDAFSLPSTDTHGCSAQGQDDCEHVSLRVASVPDLLDLARRSCDRPIVAHITYAVGVTDDPQPGATDTLRHPEAIFANYLPWLAQDALQPRRLLRVALHVRRGELFVVDTHRMLPNSYYVQVALMLGRILNEAGIPHVFEVHTEVASRPLNITAGHHGIGGRVYTPVAVDPADSHLEDFGVIEPLQMRVNEDALDSLKALATADILVMSRSSFSYVAGLLHAPGRGLVLYYPFWHRPPSHWLAMQEGLDNVGSNYEALKARALASFTCRIM